MQHRAFVLLFVVVKYLDEFTALEEGLEKKGTRYTKEAVTTVIPTRFAMKRTAPKYQDLIKQAEYAYSQIKEAK